MAVGSVDAGVDLGAVSGDDVDVSDNRRSATITPPHARLYPAELDVHRSCVYDRDEGLLNRIGGVFGGTDDGQDELYRAGEAKIAAAAQANTNSGRARRRTLAQCSRRCSARSASRA